MSKSKQIIDENTVLYYPFETWSKSQLSIARFYGGIIVNGKQYVIAEDGNLVYEKIYSLYKRYGAKVLVCAIKDSYNNEGVKSISQLSQYCKIHAAAPKDNVSQGSLF